MRARGQAAERLPGDRAELLESSLAREADAAQNPGGGSVAPSLAVLCLVLERDQDLEPARRCVSKLGEPPSLEPPDRLGTVTEQDVLDASCREEADARVRDWALDVWRAWAPHHDAIRSWLDAEAKAGTPAKKSSGR